MVFSAPLKVEKMIPLARKKSAPGALVIDPRPYEKKTPAPTAVTPGNLHTLNGIKIPFSPGKLKFRQKNFFKSL